MSGKPWEKYVTQAFIDDAVERVRRRNPGSRPPYTTDMDSGGHSCIVDGANTRVYTGGIIDVAEAIAAALNEAARPAPEPTLLEAAKVYMDHHWPSDMQRVLRELQKSPDGLYKVVARNLLLAIDRAEAAAKCPPAPTLPEDVLRVLRAVYHWHAHGGSWDWVASNNGLDPKRFQNDYLKAILDGYDHQPDDDGGAA